MDKKIRAAIDNLYSEEREVQYQAFLNVIEMTEEPVGWAYEVWDEMLENLSHKDNRRRAIGAQVLCNLAKSDPTDRMLKDFDALLEVTRDDRFVTARHTIQAIWKVGVSGKKQRSLYLNGLEGRFNECISEKNCTLIRYDILVGFRKLYDEVQDEGIRQLSLDLIETEEDPKYRKKYSGLWKEKRTSKKLG